MSTPCWCLLTLVVVVVVTVAVVHVVMMVVALIVAIVVVTGVAAAAVLCLPRVDAVVDIDNARRHVFFPPWLLSSTTSSGAG